MYFLVSLLLTIISLLLFFLLKNKKNFHFEILASIYGSSTLMWFVDCIASSIKGEGFLSFEIPTDIYISLWTLFGGLLLWIIITLIVNKLNKNKQIKQENDQ